LYITVKKNNASGPGGIFMLSNTDSLAVYYRAISGATIDTGQVSLPIGHMAASIQHTYSTTIQNELNNKTTGSRNTFYLQGLAGLKAKISFPSLLLNLRKALLAEKPASDILINRAELVITPAPGTFIPFQPLPKIGMYQLDLAGQPEVIQDASTDVRSGGFSVFGGFYSPSKGDYHFIITAFLQDQLSGKSVSSATYITPVDTTNKSSVDYFPTPQIAARTVAVGTDKTSQFRIKLNIIYTKIAKH
jgi:hypothetical protein